MLKAAETESLGPLRRLRVLDLTSRIAGPYATKLLADYGADVIKVESDPIGDPGRSWRPHCSVAGAQPHSALYSYLNANKRSLGLDLGKPEGRSLLLLLASQCDAVIESFEPGHLDSLQLGYKDLSHVRASTVLTSITNFGQHGTFRDYKATELNVYAFAGKMAASGTRPRPPVRLLAGSSLYMAGTVAAAATLVALRAARTHEAGDHIDVAIAKVVLGSPDRGLCLVSYNGADAERPDGPRPYQTFPTSDGFVVINVNRGLDRVAEMIGRPDVSEDPRFANVPLRQTHAADLEPIIIEWTVSKTKAEVIAASQQHRVIAAPVATIEEVLANEHLKARSFFRSAPWGECPCQRRMPGPPFRFHGGATDGWGLVRPARALGADSHEILGGLGLGASEIQSLVDQGVVYAPPTREGG